jgi:cyclopropane-fatty-acyl-phospholipid synthase
MSKRIARITDRQVEMTVAVLNELLDEPPPLSFKIRLWDGSEWHPETDADPRFTVILKDPGALKRMFFKLSDLSLAEAYIFGDFDLEGDVYALFEIGEWIAERGLSTSKRIKLSRAVLKLHSSAQSNGSEHGRIELDGPTHSKTRDRQAVSYHYDVSNDFYALWLDENMVYSCAYFEDPGNDIDYAQEQKLDYICRKLRLKAGERLLDIGCGWGALVRHAAHYYRVNALGITLSQLQADLANERIAEAGLSDRCKVEVCDYRDIDMPGWFDKVVSVGMFEHVGEALMPAYFDKVYTLIKPGGSFLNHGIASFQENRGAGKESNETFITKYVFPDGELVPVSKALGLAEAAGFETRDAESLREHYALTLERWLRRLEGKQDEAIAETDEVTYRIWQLFLAISVYGFRRGHLNIYQTLLVKPDNGISGLPLRRDDWYK